MGFTLRGARLVDATGDRALADLTVSGSRIHAVRVADGTADDAAADTLSDVAMSSADSQPVELDAGDMIVTPGFIDVHTHGGGGCNLHTTDPAEIHRYAVWAPRTGVTSFLIGVVGTPGELPAAQLEAAVSAIEHQSEGAEPLGIHLEGPYISKQRRGAHLPSWLRMPNPSETEYVLEITRGKLRIITLAPELPGAAAMISRMVAAGVTVSIGHTDATYEQARSAISQGATHATHCCNAMRPLHHRDPGPLSAIAESPGVYGELIADGVHVHPSMMSLLVKLLGPQRTIVITDALAGAGMPDAPFEFAGQSATIVHGAARLADGTLTGSVLTMDQALRNVLRYTGVSLCEAVSMLTMNPARAAGTPDRKGRLAPGFDADLLLLDSSLNLHSTICRGELAFVSDEWRERLAPLGERAVEATTLTGAPRPVVE